MRAYLIMAVIAACLAGCETILEVDPSGYEPELAVRSFFSPDQPHWEVEVGHTVPLNGDLTAAFVPDAVVEILHNGEVVASLAHKERGRYVGVGPAPEPGQAYTLRVRAPGYPTATAVSRMPTPVGGFEATFTDAAEQDREALASFNVRFTDVGIEEDFYQLDLMKKIGPVQQGGFYGTHPAFPREPLGELVDGSTHRPLFVGVRFSDAIFDGGPFEAELRFGRSPVHAYWVRLTRLSEDYYRYAQSDALREEVGENPFAEPVIPYSNVEGGTGVFAGYLVQDTPPVILGEITPQLVSGRYEARQLAFLQGSQILNVLPNGGHLHLTLTPDGMFIGHILIPWTVSPTGELVDEDLSGSFTIGEGILRFEDDAHTLISDIEWWYSGGVGAGGLYVMDPEKHGILATLVKEQP